MSRSFAFRWKPYDDEPTSVLVVASASSDFERSEVMALLDDDHGHDLYPDRLLFVHPRIEPDRFVGQARAAFEGGAILRMGAGRVSIHSATFDVNGRCDALAHVGGPDAAWPEEAFERVKEAGLLEVFDRRRVLMLPVSGMHFVHPSGVHSRGFLRGGNAFVNGAETVFVAMTLLAHLGPDTRQVWVDSSSIASVAYAATSLRQRFDPEYDPPHVESFGSYEGLRRTKLAHPRRSLVLISATASGGLAREVTRLHNVDKARVVNLFSSARPAVDLTVHCDVSDRPATRGEDGESLLRFVDGDDCPWCDDGSRPIRFVSDQFLADAVTYTDVMIAEADAPAGSKAFFGRFHARGPFRLERREGSDHHRLWFDVGTLEGDEAFVGDLREAARRFAPVSVTHVVHLDDPGSQWMAGVIADEVEATIGTRPEVATAAGVAGLVAPKGVVVAAGCVGSGNALQIVSRDLREVLGDQPRSYVVGIAKQGDAARLDKLRRDLVHNKSHQHQFVALQRIPLPGQDLTAWSAERALLTTILERVDGRDAARFVEERLELLSEPVVASRDDLFLRSAEGAPLALSPGFAFWPPNYRQGEASQGDVMATVAAVLHGMRADRPRGEAEAKLASNPFHTKILHPGVFGRYNDGVIQAAILRATHPHELNYGSSPELSGTMLRIVQRALERWASTQGEACPEFLLAIATRRLTLAPADRRRLGMAGPVGAPAHLDLLLRAATTDDFARATGPGGREPDAPRVAWPSPAIAGILRPTREDAAGGWCDAVDAGTGRGHRVRPDTVRHDDEADGAGAGGPAPHRHPGARPRLHPRRRLHGGRQCAAEARRKDDRHDLKV